MEKYKFYVDKKVTVWERETHEVEAESIEDAQQKMIDSFKEDLCDSGDTFVEQETLYDTLEFINPIDNSGVSTAELYDTQMNLLIDNEV